MGPEQQPAVTNDRKENNDQCDAGKRLFSDRRFVWPILAPNSIDTKDRSLIAAPKHIVPRGAVPQPAEEHRNHQIPANKKQVTAISAERHIKIIPQPG